MKNAFTLLAFALIGFLLYWFLLRKPAEQKSITNPIDDDIIGPQDDKVPSPAGSGGFSTGTLAPMESPPLSTGTFTNDAGGPPAPVYRPGVVTGGLAPDQLVAPPIPSSPKADKFTVTKLSKAQKFG